MEHINGGVTAARGFLAAGAKAEIKYKDRKDMALVYSQAPAAAAGTFTTNLVKAAPVKWDMEVVAGGRPVQAMVFNSGIANACTGGEGVRVNQAMAQATAAALGLKTHQVLTASTGVIGMQLPLDKFLAGIRKLAPALDHTREAGTMAAEAIMTTDTVSKECAVSCVIGGRKVTVGGMAKGSGMIHPNMATMLALVTTDAAITKEMAQKALSRDVETTFNMISVDRDTSTNDTLILMANAMAENPLIDSEGEDFDTFCGALHEVTRCLARKMAADGEGATKLLTAKVVGAATRQDAALMAKAVITSNLVKTAVYGSDANWGRILCAMGYSGGSFDPDRVDLTVESAAGSLKLVENGMAADYSEETATKILSGDQVTVIADVKSGDQEAEAWGCDLTYDYVKINGDYRS